MKKRVHLQKFGIIRLPNLDLTYIRNPERETKLCTKVRTLIRPLSSCYRAGYFTGLINPKHKTTLGSREGLVAGVASNGLSTRYIKT
jgi:hypothetical protein